MNHLLVIAGTDSSGGAGMTRDTATACELGFQVKPVVTSVTVQSDRAFLESHAIPSHIIREQITAAMEDSPPGAIKIGMLGTAKIARTVMESLAPYNLPVILDPVLKSSSGGYLYAGGDIRDLFPITTLLTPNLEEAAALTNRPKAANDEDIMLQAKLLLDQGANAVLIKGGHGTGADCIDHFFDPLGQSRLVAPRLAQQKRGTGCTLSTAAACYISAGHRPKDACRMAKQYVHRLLDCRVV